MLIYKRIIFVYCKAPKNGNYVNFGSDKVQSYEIVNLVIIVG